MRVLIIKLSSLGDLFHALPVARAIKSGLDAEVHWVTQPVYQELVTCFEDVDRVLTFPRSNFYSSFPAYLKKLRAEEYDLVVDLQGLLKSAALVGRLARGKKRIGPSSCREGTRLFYDEVAPARQESVHAVDQLLDTAAHLGLDVQQPEFRVRFPHPELDDTSPQVALVPCSRWKAKDWAPEYFIEVAKALQEQQGVSINLVGGPEDRGVCESIASQLPGKVRNTCGTTSLIEMGGLLKAMDLVISVDSGPMHVAAACGTKVLAIFGATDPRRTGPYGEGHRVVMAEELRKDPGLARAFKKSASIGGWTVHPAEVLEQALALLGPR